MKWIYFVVWIFFEISPAGQTRSVTYYREFATRTEASKLFGLADRKRYNDKAGTWLFIHLDSANVKKSRPLCDKPREGNTYKFFIPKAGEKK